MEGVYQRLTHRPTKDQICLKNFFLNFKIGALSFVLRPKMVSCLFRSYSERVLSFVVALCWFHGNSGMFDLFGLGGSEVDKLPSRIDQNQRSRVQLRVQFVTITLRFLIRVIQIFGEMTSPIEFVSVRKRKTTLIYFGLFLLGSNCQ